MSLIPRNGLFDLDSIFDGLGSSMMAEAKQGFFTPRIDLTETETGYHVSAELPGVKKDDIHITLEDGVLSIEAESQNESKQEADGRVLRQERRYGKFMRSFNIGRGIEQAEIKASFSDGILQLEIPRAQPQQNLSQEIPIH